jgi:hypothetical protein
MTKEISIHIHPELVRMQTGFELAINQSNGLLEIQKAREIKMQWLGEAPIVTEIMERFCLNPESAEFTDYQEAISQLRDAHVRFSLMPKSTKGQQDTAQQFLYETYQQFYSSGALLPLAQKITQQEIKQRFGLEIPIENEIIQSTAQFAATAFNPGQSPDPAEQVVLNINSTGMTFKAFIAYNLLTTIDYARQNSSQGDEIEKILKIWDNSPEVHTGGYPENPHARDIRIFTVIMRSDHEVRQ